MSVIELINVDIEIKMQCDLCLCLLNICLLDFMAFCPFSPRYVSFPSSTLGARWLVLHRGSAVGQYIIQHHHHICDSGSKASSLPPSLPPTTHSLSPPSPPPRPFLFAWALLLRDFADPKCPFMWVVYKWRGHVFKVVAAISFVVLVVQKKRKKGVLGGKNMKTP